MQDYYFFLEYVFIRNYQNIDIIKIQIINHEQKHQLIFLTYFFQKGGICNVRK